MRGFLTRFGALLLATGALPLSGLGEDGIANPEFAGVVDGLLSGSVPLITVGDFAASPRKWTVLDARPEEEYEVSHLPSALRAGYRDFSSKVVEGLDKKRPVLIYCSVGYRSEKIGERLRELGFREVYNLYGGIFEWFNQGHVVVDASGETVDRVHPYDRHWGQWIEPEKSERP